MRLVHVFDGLKAEGLELDEKKMQYIIKAMLEDIKREAEGEIVWNKAVKKAIGKATAKLTIQHFKDKLKEDS